MASITDLPIEVLLKIFQFYMQTESHKTFLDNISKVSDEWKNICLDSSLWTKYDGTPSAKKMLYLSKNGALRNTKELILSSIDSLRKKKQKIPNNSEENNLEENNLEENNLEENNSEENNSEENNKKRKVSSSFSVDETELFLNVNNVEVISFSNVKKISNETLSIVARNCSKLREIKIGKKSKIPISLTYKTLVDFFSIRGYGIKKIDFSLCKMTNFKSSMRHISDCCPNLEHLHLMNLAISLGEFPTGYVQGHCSKLKSLYIDHNIRIDNSRHPSGFQDLEVFVYSDQKGFYINDQQFECVVFNSPKLKFLSLTNCCVSASVMLSLPASSVEYLYIPRSKACSDEYLSCLLKKWSHSLKELDLSYGNCYVQHAVLKLIKTPVESPLEFLNLNSTPVHLDLVEDIIKNCSHLEILKLEGCRSVPRGMKRTYSSELEFQELTEKIRSYRSNHPTEVFTVNDS